MSGSVGPDTVIDHKTGHESAAGSQSLTVSSILKGAVVVSPEVWEGKADHITRNMGWGGEGERINTTG